MGIPKVDKQFTVLTEMNISNYVVKDYALKTTDFYYQISGKSQKGTVNVCAYRLSDYNHKYCEKVLLEQDPVSYEVVAPGYYYFRIEQPENIADYHLMITESLMILSVSQEECKCTINSNHMQCQINIPFTPLKPKYCLLAKLYQFHDKSDVRLVVQVNESRSWIIRGILLFVVLILLISFLFLSLLMLKFCNFCEWLKDKF